MSNEKLNTDLVDRAAKYAIDAHHGTERRGKGFPYVIHVMEAASIVASITNDEKLIAAAFLHDVIEDTDITADELAKEFGSEIADLVAGESDIVVEGKTEQESWKEKKEYALKRLKAQSKEAKIVAMGDKLSNLRAIYMDYMLLGDKVWEKFHAPDPSLYEWRYRALADAMSELSDTFAFKEFTALIEKIWGNK